MSEIKNMLEQLNKAAKSIDLKMNLNKTKIIQVAVKVDHKVVKHVNKYAYLGHNVKLGKTTRTPK